MAKGDLFQRALPYYVVAIAEFLNQYDPTTNGNAGWHELQLHWAHNSHDDGPTYLLEDQELFDAAMAICTRAGLVSPLLDEFGPPVYLKPNDSSGAYELLFYDHKYTDLFRKFKHTGHYWLTTALLKIIQEREKEAKAQLETKDEWEPIPLDRSNESVRTVVSTLDTVIETVRADNGYGANHPEESRFVLDGLRAVAKRIKEDTQISVMYLQEYGLKRLALVINRFGNAASGVAARAARNAVVDWLKEKGIDILKSLGS